MSNANRKPLFVCRPKTTTTAIPASANTARDGSGTIVEIYHADTPASTNGYLVECIKFVATSTVANAIINLFRSTDGGTTWKMIGQVQGNTSGVTPGTTTKSDEFFYNTADMPLRLNAGDKLGATTTVAQAYMCTVQGGALDDFDA